MRSANSDWGEWSHKNLFWITYVNVDWLGFVNIWFYVFVWLQKTKYIFNMAQEDMLIILD